MDIITRSLLYSHEARSDIVSGNPPVLRPVRSHPPKQRFPAGTLSEKCLLGADEHSLPTACEHNISPPIVLEESGHLCPHDRNNDVVRLVA